MKSIKNFLRKLDVFGVPYNFKYDTHEKYTTALGGLAVILFFMVALFFGIYYFIPFYNRKNYTTVYFTLTMSHTEQVNFVQSETAFAIGLNCWTASDGTVGDDLFRIDHKFIYYKLDNEYKKNINIIDTHKCTKADFYNKYNETFDGSYIYNYNCFLNDNSQIIEGIFTSPIFSYYEFDVYAKNESQELLDKIDLYLTENDCKFQMYYSDNTVDISDYEEPIKSYVEASFIQLNPTLSIRRNYYFMNQHLYDDDLLFSVFGDDANAKYVKTIFSRYEEYSLYQGVNRKNTSSDYLNYAKVFIRADTKRADVKRRYQKAMEFYADASSLLIAVYEVLIIIFNFFNNFWAEQDLSKKIFFFKDLEENKLRIKKRYTQIQELLELTGGISSPGKTTLNDSLKEDNIVNIKNNLEELNKKDSGSKNILQNNDAIKIYNRKKGKTIHYKRENNIKKGRILENKTKQIKKNKVSGNRDDSNNNYEGSSNQYQRGESRFSLNFRHNMNIKRKNYKDNKKNEDYQESQINISKRDEVLEQEIIQENVVYDFNILEILGATIFKCCQTKKLNIKYILNEKANSILFSKLDINLFVRNMILLDIINETILGLSIKNVINFLSRPIISLKGKERNDVAIFYRRYKSSDFKKFLAEVNELAQKSDKCNEEKDLISLTNKHLKQLLE